MSGSRTWPTDTSCKQTQQAISVRSPSDLRKGLNLVDYTWYGPHTQHRRWAKRMQSWGAGSSSKLTNARSPRHVTNAIWSLMSIADILHASLQDEMKVAPGCSLRMTVFIRGPYRHRPLIENSCTTEKATCSNKKQRKLAQRPVEYSGKKIKKNQKLCYQVSQIKCLTDEQSYKLILVKTEANVDFKFLQVICCIDLHWITKIHMLWIFMEKYSHNIHSFEI
jgi:hypothetical protein